MLTLDGTNKIVAENLNTEVTTLLTPKNWIINGGFDVWQRGTSFSGWGFVADRWLASINSSTASITKQPFTLGQTDVPNNPTNYLSFNVSVSGNVNWFQQRIEDVLKFSGKTVSLSFWIKSSSITSVTLDSYAVYGTGGSTSNQVYTTTYSINSTWTRKTFTFTLPSASGKTVGNNSYFEITPFIIASGTTGTVYIANVSLVEGSVPVEWQTEAYADVLRQCQRYYQRYNADTNMSVFSPSGIGSTSNVVEFIIPTKVTMRTLLSSVEYLNLAIGNVGVGLINVSSASITSSQCSKDYLFLNATSSGITQYRPYLLLSNNTSNSYIAFNAEL